MQRFIGNLNILCIRDLTQTRSDRVGRDALEIIALAP